MKQLLLTAFACLFFLIDNQAQTYQDTTFTDPVIVSFPLDFVTFKHCRFIGIDGDALTLEGAGALISNCTFENINGTAISATVSEVYVVEDTFSNITGRGVQGFGSAMITLGSVFTQIHLDAVALVDCEVGEVSDCTISDSGGGVDINGGDTPGEYVLKNNLIHGMYSLPGTPMSGNGISVQKGASVTIEACTIDSCLGVGILVDYFGAPNSNTDILKIQDNKISRIGFYGLVGGPKAYHAVVRNNEISYPGFTSGWAEYGEPCMSWAGPDALIEGNDIHHAVDTVCNTGNCGVGILLSTSATLTRNHIHDCTGNGIEYRKNADAGNDPLRVFNNIIHDVGGHPFFFSGAEVTPGFSEPNATVIRNNTLHSVESTSLSLCCNSDPISIEGNIFIVENEPDTSKYIEISNAGSIIQSFNFKSPTDLGFVDFAGRNFHLASETSPAHNALPLNFGLPNDDYDGDVRFGLRDAGADEIAATAPICGCNNCPNEIPQLFFGDFTFAVLAAEKNDLSASGQGVCGVRVQFEHEYIGDIQMQLISPAGQSVQLVGPSGFWGSTNTTFWNIGFVPCSIDASPDPGFSALWNSNQSWGEAGSYTGTYYPAGGCLEDFNQGTVTGDWTLRVFDSQADDSGSVLGFEVTFCNAEGVSCFACSEPPVAQFNSNPASSWGTFLNNATTGNVDNYFLDYGDGETESGPLFSPFHLYENAGTYLVRLIATNECGADTFSQLVQIAGALPAAFASAEPSSGCSPLQVQTVIINADHVDNWHWFFPGGTPAESFEMAPQVTYSTPGQYEVSLTIGNEVGNASINAIFTVTVEQGLSNPSFLVQVIGDSILCTNTTQNTSSFYWTLDGGAPVGLDTNPFVFEVEDAGDYIVGLTVSDLCQSITLVEVVPVVISAVSALELKGWEFLLAPNPNQGQFSLRVGAAENADATLRILNTLGMEVYARSLQFAKGENLTHFELGQLPSGVYQLQMLTNKGRANLGFILEK